MQHQEIEPPEALRDAIMCFWYISIELEKLSPGFEILPDGYAEIIFYFGGNCTIATGNGLQPLSSPFLVGLLGQPAVLHAESPLQIIGIKCFPWAIFDLLGLPSGKDSVRIFEHPVARLQPTLNKWLAAGRIDEALTEVKQYFLDARSKLATDTMLFKAGAAMRKANGGLPVSQVAMAAHATVRTLERNFKQSSGYTVKDVLSLMRFEQVRNHLWRYPAVNLAGLAQELGYADQAHLSREFKRYSGVTPTAFARKAKSGKRSLPNDFAAIVPAP